MLTITRRGLEEVYEGKSEDRQRKTPANGGLRGAAGLGFEPRLTDPESVSIYPWLFTAVQKTAYLSEFSESRVSSCSPLFTPVTVKSLSEATATDLVSW
jgi:hypothetical protein